MYFFYKFMMTESFYIFFFLSFKDGPRVNFTEFIDSAWHLPPPPHNDRDQLSVVGVQFQIFICVLKIV